MITIGINKPQSSGTVVLPLIEKTHFELLSMKKVGDLIAGQKYLLTDFQTIYDQPDYDIAGNPKIYVDTKLGYVEPLILEAVSTSEFSPVVRSTVFTDDIIHYDIDWTITEAMNVPAKGIITKRIDDRNNECYFDSRAILFKRYEKVEGSGIFEEFKDTGFASAELPTFDEVSYNNLISKSENFELFSEPFLLPNIIFSNTKNVKIAASYALSSTLVNCIDSIFLYEIGQSFLKNISKSEFKMVWETNLFGSWNAVIGGIYNSSIVGFYDVEIGYLSLVTANYITNIHSICEGVFFDIDLTASTFIQNGIASKEAHMNQNGDKIISYYDETNTLVTANITD